MLKEQMRHSVGNVLKHPGVALLSLQTITTTKKETKQKREERETISTSIIDSNGGGEEAMNNNNNNVNDEHDNDKKSEASALVEPMPVVPIMPAMPGATIVVVANEDRKSSNSHHQKKKKAAYSSSSTSSFVQQVVAAFLLLIMMMNDASAGATTRTSIRSLESEIISVTPVPRCEDFKYFNTTYNNQPTVMPYYGIMFSVVSNSGSHAIEIGGFELDLRDDLMQADIDADAAKESSGGGGGGGGSPFFGGGGGGGGGKKNNNKKDDDYRREIEIYSYDGGYRMISNTLENGWIPIAKTHVHQLNQTVWDDATKRYYKNRKTYVVPATKFSRVLIPPNGIRSFYITMVGGPYLDNTVDAFDVAGDNAYENEDFTVLTGNGLSSPNIIDGIDETTSPKFAGKIAYRLLDGESSGGSDDDVVCDKREMIDTVARYKFVIDQKESHDIFKFISSGIDDIIDKELSSNSDFIFYRQTYDLQKKHRAKIGVLDDDDDDESDDDDQDEDGASSSSIKYQCRSDWDECTSIVGVVEFTHARSMNVADLQHQLYLLTYQITSRASRYLKEGSQTQIEYVGDVSKTAEYEIIMYKKKDTSSAAYGTPSPAVLMDEVQETYFTRRTAYYLSSALNGMGSQVFDVNIDKQKSIILRNRNRNLLIRKAGGDGEDSNENNQVLRRSLQGRDGEVEGGTPILNVKGKIRGTQAAVYPDDYFVASLLGALGSAGGAAERYRDDMALGLILPSEINADGSQAYKLFSKIMYYRSDVQLYLDPIYGDPSTMAPNSTISTDDGEDDGEDDDSKDVEDFLVNIKDGIENVDSKVWIYVGVGVGVLVLAISACVVVRCCCNRTKEPKRKGISHDDQKAMEEYTLKDKDNERAATIDGGKAKKKKKPPPRTPSGSLSGGSQDSKDNNNRSELDNMDPAPRHPRSNSIDGGGPPRQDDRPHAPLRRSRSSGDGGPNGLQPLQPLPPSLGSFMSSQQPRNGGNPMSGSRSVDGGPPPPKRDVNGPPSNSMRQSRSVPLDKGGPPRRDGPPSNSMRQSRSVPLEEPSTNSTRKSRSIDGTRSAGKPRSLGSFMSAQPPTRNGNQLSGSRSVDGGPPPPRRTEPPTRSMRQSRSVDLEDDTPHSDCTPLAPSKSKSPGAAPPQRRDDNGPPSNSMRQSRSVPLEEPNNNSLRQSRTVGGGPQSIAPLRTRTAGKPRSLGSFMSSQPPARNGNQLSGSRSVDGGPPPPRQYANGPPSNSMRESRSVPLDKPNNSTRQSRSIDGGPPSRARRPRSKSEGNAPSLGSSMASQPQESNSNPMSGSKSVGADPCNQKPRRAGRRPILSDAV